MPPPNWPAIIIAILLLAAGFGLLRHAIRGLRTEKSSSAGYSLLAGVLLALVGLGMLIWGPNCGAG